MPDIHELLSLASDGDIAVTASEDLNRARGQLIRRRRARVKVLSASLGGLAALAAVGVVVTNSDDPSLNPSISASPSANSIHLVSADVTEGAFSFGKVPDSWTIQRATRSSVLMTPPGQPYGVKVPPSKADIARPKPDGSIRQRPNSFEGKLLIYFDQYPLSGSTSTVSGRTYAIESGDGYTTISVDTLPGQPNGVVRVQYPTVTGWSQSTLREFLGSVTVNATAQPSV
jgi:hypothetical protein